MAPSGQRQITKLGVFSKLFRVLLAAKDRSPSSVSHGFSKNETFGGNFGWDNLMQFFVWDSGILMVFDMF